jgi:hypothetical protein
MNVTEEVGKVANTAVSAMQSTPLAIALLVVNCGFLAFTGYILAHVAENASLRNTSQMDMINKLVTDIRDCRQPPGGRLGQLEHLLPAK